MNYKQYKYDNYNLHIINTKKFVKTSIQVKYRYNLTEQKYNELLLLSEMLEYSTKTYNTNQLLNKEMKKNYNAYTLSLVNIVGNNIIRSVAIESLSDNVVKDKVFSKSLELLNEVLYNPNITNGEFDSKSFDIIYKEIINRIKVAKENNSVYAEFLMKKKMNKNAPYAIPYWGNINILKNINVKNLYNVYLDAITNCNVDIFVIGDVNNDDVKKQIDKVFADKKINTSNYTCYYELKPSNKTQEIIKSKNTNQANLEIGLDALNLTPFERKYVLDIYSDLLGGSATSKLFKNVREKYSLAYYASSKSYPFNNLLIVSTGIDKKNYNKALDLIKKYVKEMENNIDSKNFKFAIENYINYINENYDSIFFTINMYYNSILREENNVEDIINNVKKITLNDVKNLAKKIKINTVYLYGGDIDAEN